MTKLFAVLLLASLPVLAACNTVEGVGQDVKKGGQNLESAADRNK